MQTSYGTTPPRYPHDGDRWINITTGEEYRASLARNGAPIWELTVQPPQRRRSTPAPTPFDVTRTPLMTVAQLPPGGPTQGDLWWNPTTGREAIFYQDASSAQWVVTQPSGGSGGGGGGGGGAIDSVTGGVGIDGGGSSGDIVLSLEPVVGLTPGTYGDGSNIPVVTVDEFGRVTTIGIIAWVDPNTAVTPGTYGDNAHTAAFSVSANGRITSAASVPISLSAIGAEPALGYTPVNQAGDTMTGALHAVAPGPSANDDTAVTSAWVNAAIAAALATATSPVGAIMAYGGSAAPAGWALCDGGTESRTGRPALFAAIGTTYGAGDGSTTFNRPDLRGRVIAHPDSGAGRLGSGNNGGFTGAAARGAGAGEQSHTVTAAEMPSHNHGVNDPQHVHYSLGGGNFAMGGGSYSLVGLTYGTNFYLYQDGNYVNYYPTGVTIQATGGGGAANNVQPTLIINYIIKVQ